MDLKKSYTYLNRKAIIPRTSPYHHLSATNIVSIMKAMLAINAIKPNNCDEALSE